MSDHPRIDELRARVGVDPKSRHFYPLGEELRKSGQLEESEQVLRDGLAHHPNYLSAWISLGRVLRDQAKHREALEILQRAFSLDGSNVVTARLMAESFRELGDHVEAIKKFKLVRALLPPDEELEQTIASLEAAIASPLASSVAPEPEPQSQGSAGAPEPFASEPPETEGDSEPFLRTPVLHVESPPVSSQSASPDGEGDAPFPDDGPFALAEDPISLPATDSDEPFDATTEVPAGQGSGEPVQASEDAVAVAREGGDPRVARLSSWLERVRRNAGVS